MFIHNSSHKLINSQRHTHFLIFKNGLCFISKTEIHQAEIELQRKHGISINMKKCLIPYKRHIIWLI